LKALKTIEEIVKQDPANIGAKQLLSKTFSMLGQTSTNTGKPQEAVLYLEKAYEVLRGITESRTKNNGLKTDLTVLVMRLGEAKSKQEKFKDALADFQQAANIHLEILQNLPDDTRTKRNLAWTYDSIAETHAKIAERESGEKSLAARDLAKDYYQKTLDLLLQLEAKNLLGDYDRKFLEGTKKAMQEFE
jgi:tetratricopeptide (TPR) repeat protein